MTSRSQAKLSAAASSPAPTTLLMAEKCGLIYRYVMRSEVLFQIGREWSAALVIFRPEDAYRLRALEPR